MNWAWLETAGEGGSWVKDDSPAIALTDRGWTLGDGLFETMRVDRGTVLFIERHLRRLAQGLAIATFSPVPWGSGALAERCRAVVRKNAADSGVLRLTISRGPGPRGLPPPDPTIPTLSITIGPLPAASAVRSSGLRAVLGSWRVDPASPLCYIKHLGALDRILARQAAIQAGADEAIFKNLSGFLTEATSSNLFIVSSDRILTPPVASGLLPGTVRGLLLESASKLPLPVVEAEIAAHELTGATEAFLTNAVAGVQPLVAFGGHPIGTGMPGPITAAVARCYHAACEMDRERAEPAEGLDANV